MPGAIVEVVRFHGWNRYDPMDGGGRTASGTAVESRVWNRDRDNVWNKLSSGGRLIVFLEVEIPGEQKNPDSAR